MKTFAKSARAKTLAGFFIFLTSCSGFVNKVATDTTASLAEVGSTAPYSIPQYDYFTKALPGNILFMESLLANSPRNSTLFAQLIKAYSSYGFGYGETEMIKRAQSFQYSEMKNHAQLATLWYAKSVDYGDQWLKSKGTSLKGLIEAGLDLETKKSFLDTHFNDSDAPGLFYLGQAWASYLNFNRHRPELVAQLPHAKILIDYSCQINPDLDFGACGLFKAVYLLSRPKMLGGNPVEGEKVLISLMKQYPLHLLYPLAYMQYVLVPQDRTSELKSAQAKVLEQLNIWEKSLYQLPTEKGYAQKQQDPYRMFHLFNAIASERASIFKTRK